MLINRWCRISDAPREVASYDNKCNVGGGEEGGLRLMQIYF